MHHRGNGRPVDRLSVGGVNPKPALQPTDQTGLEAGEGRRGRVTERRSEQGGVEETLWTHTPAALFPELGTGRGGAGRAERTDSDCAGGLTTVLRRPLEGRREGLR